MLLALQHSTTQTTSKNFFFFEEQEAVIIILCNFSATQIIRVPMHWQQVAGPILLNLTAASHPCELTSSGSLTGVCSLLDPLSSSAPSSTSLLEEPSPEYSYPQIQELLNIMQLSIATEGIFHLDILS